MLVFTEHAKRFIAVARQAFVGACVRAAVVSVAGLGLLTLLGLLSPHFWLADRAADLRVQVALLLPRFASTVLRACTGTPARRPRGQRTLSQPTPQIQAMSWATSWSSWRQTAMV